MKNSFVFYDSFLEALDELDSETELIVYRAITHYALKGEEPELKGIAKAVFSLIKPQIDANNKRYEDGKKGGRPKIKTSGFENKKPVVLKNEENKKPNVNVNVNVNENVNDNVIQKEIKEKVVCEGQEVPKTFYTTRPHPDLMFDADVNKIYKIYEDNCPNLIPVGFGFRDLRKRQRIKEFLNVISGDFDYFQKVCSKANTLKVIAGNKIDIDSVMNNHVGIFNEKYQTGETTVDYQEMARNIAAKMKEGAQ